MKERIRKKRIAFISIVVMLITFSLGGLLLGQEVTKETLSIELKELKLDQGKLIDSLAIIESRMKRINFLLDSLEVVSFGGEYEDLKIEPNSPVRDKAGYPATTLYTTKAGDKGIIIDIYENNYVKVRINGIEGYVHYLNFIDFKSIQEQIQKKKRISEKIKEDERKVREERLDLIKNRIAIIEKKPVWVKSDAANLRSSPSTSGEVIQVIERGDKLYEIAREGEWVNLLIRDYDKIDLFSFDIDSEKDNYIEGWMHSSIVSEELIRPYSITEQIRRNTEKRRRDFVTQNESSLTEQNKSDILNGSIRIGMTKEMVIASWGEPDDVNRTVTQFTVREQLIYGTISNRTYLYIVDGILTSFQD
ncbi:MAG: SH3 domain-containing protein [Balneolaceae bacterium]|nr:SH3 domain-containing protein [Balneolaceae bacterium]MBO6546399.1 SH3 domain-containing protein [Balneolaceae bacterium]MBO6648758.1 SH3 domain-containing protein [Balneolaceae bacterium]